VKKISDRQASLFDVSAYESEPESKYLWEDGDNQELGTRNFPVPNSTSPKLGTEKFPVPNSTSSVPNSPLPELGTEKNLVPNSDFEELGTGKTTRTRDQIWKPPVGLLTQKWIKTDWYWYWQYYDNRRKKRSIYLGKKYNKAVMKAQQMGIPADAKPPKVRATSPTT
jgi:hypothetical protein